ncbi:hypothetical protein CSW42_03205, partial [Thermus scotoductus]
MVYLRSFGGLSALSRASWSSFWAFLPFSNTRTQAFRAASRRRRGRGVDLFWPWTPLAPPGLPPPGPPQGHPAALKAWVRVLEKGRKAQE